MSESGLPLKLLEMAVVEKPVATDSSNKSAPATPSTSNGNNGSDPPVKRARLDDSATSGSSLFTNWALDHSSNASELMEEFADCTIEVSGRKMGYALYCIITSPIAFQTMDGETIRAQRLQLAAHSPVFRRMLTSSQFEESTSGKIKMADFGAGAVRGLLHYLTRGCVTEKMQQECGRELFRLADKYELLDLKAHMAHHLGSTITEENVYEMARLADMHSSDELKKYCGRFLIERADTTIASPEWAKLKKDNASLAIALLEAGLLAEKR